MGWAFSLLAGAMLLAGCGTTQVSQDGFASVDSTGATAAASLGSPAAQPENPDAAKSEHVFRVGDPITVIFSDLPIPTAPYDEQVKEDGTITLLLNQHFTAAGKTRGELEKEIRARYVPKYYVNMTVTVRPKEATQFYYVGGEVKTPGRQIYISRLTVTKAIQSAGDFTDFAKRSKVQLIRVDGRSYTINADKALRDPKLDLEVYPGDKIHVPRRIF